ncbi:hypothetical protein [Desulfuribacillus alkaliarsenatis]|uniref:Uncharacterized protein n=1 Tax=Desulfuribacillus alkaliarsenatis TaxID=766136 RepID=A0A1E5FZY0_9FIRM|nr:hypothetical protein [Desulfuribacillus alkaliarsenatis]OEF96114.1 hypothetical protein BHF68_10305 [Desulfuribacillus alkaliarsenatis]
MIQKKSRFLAIIVIFLVSAGYLYFYFFSKPTEFLKEDDLIETINRYNYNPDAIEIQDIIFLGDTHVFVPFIHEHGYGTSYWFWKNRKWELAGVSTIQQPTLWKVNPKDPSTYVVLWNINPDNLMTTFDIYLLNRRGYIVSNYVHRYTPGVQLHFSVPFEKDVKSYGVQSLPKEWIAFLDSFLKVEKSKYPTTLFSFQHSRINYRWIPYDDNGEVSFPTFNQGTGHSTGNINLLYISRLLEHELE